MRIIKVIEGNLILMANDTSSHSYLSWPALAKAPNIDKIFAIGGQGHDREIYKQLLGSEVSYYSAGEN